MLTIIHSLYNNLFPSCFTKCSLPLCKDSLTARESPNQHQNDYIKDILSGEKCGVGRGIVNMAVFIP